MMSSIASPKFNWRYDEGKLYFESFNSTFCFRVFNAGFNLCFWSNIDFLATLVGRRHVFAVSSEDYYHFYGQVCLLLCLGKHFTEQNSIFLLSNLFIALFLLSPLCLFWKRCSKTMAKMQLLEWRKKENFNLRIISGPFEVKLYTILKLTLCSFIRYVWILGAIGCL